MQIENRRLTQPVNKKQFLHYLSGYPSCQSFFSLDRFNPSVAKFSQGWGEACFVQHIKTAQTRDRNARGNPCLPTIQEFNYLKTAITEGIASEREVQYVNQIIQNIEQCIHQDPGTIQEKEEISEIRRDVEAKSPTVADQYFSQYLDNIYDTNQESYSFDANFDQTTDTLVLSDKDEITREEFIAKRHNVSNRCSKDIELYNDCITRTNDPEKCKPERIAENLCTTTSYCAPAFKTCIGDSQHPVRELLTTCMNVVGKCGHQVSQVSKRVAIERKDSTSKLEQSTHSVKFY